MDVYLRGTRIRLDPAKSIGKGGEADVFLIDGTHALKVFKRPNHPDFKGFSLEQRAARERIAEHQKKLRVFPANLPAHVIVPEELATDTTGQSILGYTMKFIGGAEPLLRYTERAFRQAGISNEKIIEILCDLHQTVAKIHEVKVVIGDFNDLNVLVLGAAAYIIDADSFQFGSFFCRMFTARFLDPLLCDPKTSIFGLTKPYTPDSDWYAFNVMLMQCLLSVDPYGGIYVPKDIRKKIPHGKRPLHRITVFNPEVRYPKPAVPYKILPDDLLEHFHRVFEKDLRGKFPVNILENIHWTRCLNCGMEHARSSCPNCALAAPAAIREVTVIRGKVVATRIFQTKGLILFADFQGGELKWLYHDEGKFKREKETVIMIGTLDPQIRYRLQGEATLMGKANQLVTLRPNRQPERIAVDCYGNLPIFDANERFRYWLQNGRLMRDGQFGPEHIGEVLSGQTLFWVGSRFGFGFYRAGNLSVAFVFDAERRGINDNVKFLPLRGQLVDSTCVFARDRCWFFVATQEGAATVNQCMVVRPDGSVEATARAEQGDGSWLSAIRGKCAASNFIFAATDEGIIRLEPQNGQIVQTREFPDTEPFVDASCHLFPGKEVLYVVSRQEVRTLKIG